MGKEKLREEMKQKRRMLLKEEILEKSLIICKIVLDVLEDAKTVCVYKSAFREVNTEFLIDNLRSQGKKIIFPVSNVETKTITLCEDTNSFKEGAYGILEPEIKKEVNPDMVDAFVVPGIAFDKDKNRLGFGAGYYDRLLKNLRVKKVGICYDFQVAESIDATPNDVKMDLVITDKRIFW